MIQPRLVTVRLTRQLDPMFIPYMSRKIILSLDPFIPDPPASRNRTIYAFVEVLHFLVAI